MAIGPPESVGNSLAAYLVDFASSLVAELGKALTNLFLDFVRVCLI
jgi:hypothetical protein